MSEKSISSQAGPIVSPLNRKKRLTPCRSVCSTTYGDLVCRGCKRFAHEVTEWNHFGAERRDQIWERLETIYKQSIRACVRISSTDLFDRVVSSTLDEAQSCKESEIYEVLQKVEIPVVELGLTPVDSPPQIRSGELFQEIEHEIYSRSLHLYQYYYKSGIPQS
ncbi:MAG: DUF1289 domain-containing protein [Gammaproteobacteria bacterium]|nr:DUF1289 domain-containing protein [Gammaproteobacteria bacterium]